MKGETRELLRMARKRQIREWGERIKDSEDSRETGDS